MNVSDCIAAFEGAFESPRLVQHDRIGIHLNVNSKLYLYFLIRGFFSCTPKSQKIEYKPTFHRKCPSISACYFILILLNFSHFSTSYAKPVTLFNREANMTWMKVYNIAPLNQSNIFRSTPYPFKNIYINDKEMHSISTDPNDSKLVPFKISQRSKSKKDIQYNDYDINDLETLQYGLHELFTRPHLMSKIRTSKTIHFSHTMEKNIVIKSSETAAYLRCHIENLTPNDTVSWIRRNDMHILTVGDQRFTRESKFHILKNDTFGEYTLQIKYPSTADQGIYECQVSSNPKKLSILFKLSVTDLTNRESVQTTHAALDNLNRVGKRLASSQTMVNSVSSYVYFTRCDTYLRCYILFILLFFYTQIAFNI